MIRTRWLGQVLSSELSSSQLNQLSELIPSQARAQGETWKQTRNFHTTALREES